MQEGFLRRLSASPYRDRFVLKGGLLLHCLSESSSRTTRDIDLLGKEIANDTETMKAVVSEICLISEDDALRFDCASLEAENITEANKYHGIRISVTCYLGNIRNTLQVDVGFGDAVVPSSQTIDYPVLVDGRSFQTLSYPLASVIAEKFEAMIALADINSRMKDFWDVAYLLENHDIPDAELLRALRATFNKRGTPMPAEPAVLSLSYATSTVALTRWTAFLKRSHLPNRQWEDVLSIIRARLGPLYREVKKRN